MRIRRVSPFLFALFCLAGCAKQAFVIQDYKAPARVAVLPFTNETNDVGGPETVRKLMIQMLPSRGYHPGSAESVNEVLKKKFGISEGGQLNSVTTQKLGEALKVDALFYGNLITFVDFPFGFGRKRTVKARLKLVDAATGTLLWETEKGWTTPEIHVSPKEAKKAAVRQVAERQIEKMAGSFLKRESALMLELALKQLPLAN